MRLLLVTHSAISFCGFDHRRGREIFIKREAFTAVKEILKKALTIIKPESKRILPFMCPKCGAEVDATSSRCPGCGAHFLIGIYVCGNCGERVSADEEVCPNCGTTFFTGKERYFCPECGAEVEKDATYCEKCHSTFWSPIKREF